VVAGDAVASGVAGETAGEAAGFGTSTALEVDWPWTDALTLNAKIVANRIYFIFRRPVRL
jgi:hypothetical protein